MRYWCDLPPLAPFLTPPHPSSSYAFFTDTCYGSGGGLCHATTTDPTAPAPGLWTRYGVMWSGKSAALLIRDAPPHYLYQGDSNIQLWTTTDLFNYTLVTSRFITPRGDHFDNDLVEAGPPPLLLEDGNYLFLHNSANNSAGHCYHPGYVILSGADPSVILQRSEVPLLSPTRDWELGDAPAECNVQCVVFLEAAAPVDGSPNLFDVSQQAAPRARCRAQTSAMGCSLRARAYSRAIFHPSAPPPPPMQVWFGGSDAVVGTARLQVAKPRGITAPLPSVEALS